MLKVVKESDGRVEGFGRVETDRNVAAKFVGDVVISVGELKSAKNTPFWIDEDSIVVDELVSKAIVSVERSSIVVNDPLVVVR